MNEFKIKNNPKETYNINDIHSLVSHNRYIQLIKDYRMVSGLGLKMAKDAIDNLRTNVSDKDNPEYKYDVDGLITLFKSHFINPVLTKQEFINMIDKSIDSMDTYQFTDMLDAVQVLLDNIKKRGGLEAIAMERDAFLESI